MEAKELRIGNLINVFRYPTDNGLTAIEVVAIDETHVELKDGFLVNHDTGIEPIPLTEEYAADLFGYECILEMISCLMEDSKFKIFIEVSDFIKLNVHDVQNLWLDLTGEELKIENK